MYTASRQTGGPAAEILSILHSVSSPAGQTFEVCGEWVRGVVIASVA